MKLEFIDAEIEFLDIEAADIVTASPEFEPDENETELIEVK